MILVTQSFGKESEYRRVVLAILSYYAHSTNQTARTVLFTDAPIWFEPYFIGLPIDFILLTPKKVKEMRGEIDFLHRMKIALIEEAFQLYQTDILYFDSDTFFIADPMPFMAQLSPQKSFMHLCEYQFESIRNMPLPAGATFQAFVQLIEKKSFQLSDRELPVTANMSSWNAGVMMLHNTHSSLIPDVYRLTDYFFPETKNHASEQYAFSILLQTKTQLSACDEMIYHYWYNIKKRIIDEFLPDEFSFILKKQSLPERLDFIRSITARLPAFFDNHLYSIKDNAIQSFNANDFLRGYNWAIKAIFAGAIKDKTFIKDVLYHLKRQITR
jgi:hypothetical protein